MDPALVRGMGGGAWESYPFYSFSSGLFVGKGGGGIHSNLIARVRPISCVLLLCLDLSRHGGIVSDLVAPFVLNYFL